MTPVAAKLIWVASYVVLNAIRLPHLVRAFRTPVAERRERLRDGVLVALAATGLAVFPAIYLTTRRLAFADRPFHPLVAWLGVVVLVAGLTLFWRSHHDLGRAWSRTLEIRTQHRVIMHGIYARLRHPMYAAFWLLTIAQALLLPNWIAGFSGLVGFGALFFGRVGREERMMLETFGEEYREYMRRTRRIVPGIY
jgi:protein-S-isoprenylcysteine O-methyltransferase Ste14